VKKKFVLDAWAILALLQMEEPAASRVKMLLEEGEAGNIKLFISIINFGEVVYRVGKVKGELAAQETMEDIRQLALTIVPADEESVFRAVKFKIRFPISYADAFAAAAAEALDATLVTGDPELLQLAHLIHLEKLHRRR